MYRTIVVPLDRSSGSEGAIAHGAAIARQAGAELELLTVRPTYVHRTAEDLHARHDVKAEWDTAHARRPAAAIARFATGLPGSVIALTTRGRSGYGRLALGSVALAVAHRATVPVLIQQSPSAA